MASFRKGKKTINKLRRLGIKIAPVIIFVLILQGCSSLGCFSIDGKSYSSCLGKEKFEKLCRSKGGLNYHLGQSKGVCNDGTEFN